MHKIIVPLLIITIGFSSCRPSYMRCPKNKRCVAIPLEKENSLCKTTVNVPGKELITHQL